MSLQLTESVSTYFAISNGADIARVEESFTDDAVVLDEGASHRGHKAIQAWMQGARTKYEYSVEPVTTNANDDTVNVVANVVGNFPGSPVQLDYAFQLEGSKIKSLEIG